MTSPIDASQTATAAGPPSSWSEFAESVGARLDSLRQRAEGTFLESDVEHVVRDANKLCEHVAHLHLEAHRWFTENSKNGEGTRDEESQGPRTEVQRAAVNIHREQHEQSEHPMQVIKALLMWVDTPEERVRESDPSTTPG